MISMHVWYPSSPKSFQEAHIKCIGITPRAVKDDYTQCRQQLCEVFNNQDFVRTFQNSLTARPRSPNEHIDVYVAELKNLVSQAFPDYTANQKEAETLRRLLAGISPFLRGKCHENDVRDLAAAVRICKNSERAQKEYQQILHPPQIDMPTPAPVIAQIEPITPPDNPDPILAQLLDEFKKVSLATSTTTSVLDELKRQGDTLQHIVKELRTNSGRDRDYRDFSRSRSYDRRRDQYDRRRDQYDRRRDQYNPNFRSRAGRSTSYDRQQNVQRRDRTSSFDRNNHSRSDCTSHSSRDTTPRGSRRDFFQRNDRSFSSDRRSPSVPRRYDSILRPSRSPSHSSPHSPSRRHVSFDTRQENDA